MGHDSVPGVLRKPSRASAPPLRRWDAFLTENVKWLIVTILIPVVIGLTTHLLGVQAAARAAAASDAADRRAAADRKAIDDRARQDSRQRAYTELVNKREEAEMGVRSAIFSTLLHDYLDPTKANLPAVKSNLSQRMTVLELLAANFDESLNLSPLFWQFDREVAMQPPDTRIALRKQLGSIADAVKLRQVDVLAASGVKKNLSVQFVNYRDAAFEEPLRFVDPAALTASAMKGCQFKLSVLDHDTLRHRFFVVVKADRIDSGPSTSSSCLDMTKQPPEALQWNFWVDEFDFPLITYARLSTTERFAVVLVAYDEQQRSAEFNLVFFPSSRGGARDRPFIDTVIQALNDPPREPAVPKEPSK